LRAEADAAAAEAQREHERRLKEALKAAEAEKSAQKIAAMVHRVELGCAVNVQHFMELSVVDLQ
jgi:hypothetical protein